MESKIETIKHNIKNPSGIRIIVSMTFTSLILLTNIINFLNEKKNVYLLFAMVAIFLLSLVILLFVLYRTFQKPTELFLYNESLLLNGRTIQAEEVKVLMIMGYFRPVIGIKPYGKLLVPVNMCFRFSKDEEAGIADIINWAEKNNIENVNKSFLKWI